MSLLDDVTQPVGLLRIMGQTSGPMGIRTIDPRPISTTDASNETREIYLTSGDNIIPVAKKSRICVITPPKGNTVSLRLKGASGDVGVLLHPDIPWALSLESTTQTEIIIRAGSAMTSPTQFAFI